MKEMSELVPFQTATECEVLGPEGPTTEGWWWCRERKGWKPGDEMCVEVIPASAVSCFAILWRGEPQPVEDFADMEWAKAVSPFQPQGAQAFRPESVLVEADYSLFEVRAAAMMASQEAADAEAVLAISAALAKEYVDRTEAYDHQVCTGPIINGAIMPRTADERVLINRHARSVSDELQARARVLGISAVELNAAIRRHRE